MLRDENENEGNEVQINGLVSGNQSWFFPRAKCYPLLSLMLAVNQTKIDLLSLGVQGQELEVNLVLNIFSTSTTDLIHFLIQIILMKHFSRC